MSETAGTPVHREVKPSSNPASNGNQEGSSRINFLHKVLAKVKGKAKVDSKPREQEVESDGKNRMDQAEDGGQPQNLEEPPQESRVIEEQQVPELGESEEITRARQLVFEITQEVKEWDSIESGEVGQTEVERLQAETNLVALDEIRDEVKDRLFRNASSKIIGADRRSRFLTRVLGHALQEAQSELELKSNIRRDFQKIKLLDARIEDAALSSIGVTSREELEGVYAKREDEIKKDIGIFSNLNEAQKDLVWGVVRPYIERSGRGYSKESLMAGGGLDNLWMGNTDIFDGSEYNILEEIYKQAKESGDEKLEERMRGAIASWAVGITKNIDRDRREFYPEITESFLDRSREELLRHGINLAEIVDCEQPDVEARPKLAAELGVDSSELSFLSDVYGHEKEFLEKLITGDLSVPLSEQPEYFRGFLARELQDFTYLDRLATTFPIEKISTSDFFRVLGERLSADSVISEKAQARVREIQILGDAPSMSTALRTNYRIVFLVQRIAQNSDWQRLGKKFDAIVARGDELGIAWEYFRLGTEVQGGFQLRSQISEIPGKVPGLPENLQWANLSREQRKRLLRSYAQDEETLSAGSLKVEDLSHLGEAFVTKAVLREIVGQSQGSESKSKADARNRETAVSAKATLRAGDLIHGTDVNNLYAILAGGDRAGEFLGIDQKSDVTPLAADFSEVLETEVSGEFKYSEKAEFLPAEEQRRIFAENPFRAIYLGSIAVQYGAREGGMHTSQDAVSSPETGVTLIFSRQRPDAFLKGTEYRGHMREHHALVFVGLPGTEISGIIVNGDAVETIDKVRNEIVANGFYIPIYDLNGDLIFSAEEYDQMKVTRGNPEVAS